MKCEPSIPAPDTWLQYPDLLYPWIVRPKQTFPEIVLQGHCVITKGKVTRQIIVLPFRLLKNRWYTKRRNLKEIKIKKKITLYKVILKHNIPERILNLELYYKTTNCQYFLMERSIARDNKRCSGAQIQTAIYFVCSNIYSVFYLVGCLNFKMFR